MKEAGEMTLALRAEDERLPLHTPRVVLVESAVSRRGGDHEPSIHPAAVSSSERNDSRDLLRRHPHLIGEREVDYR